ncbi:MAG: bifunctional diaminohydroxyphosphoribosylaminopyrimidine deaminase/5-amino-6-(5-phosphoribosylamino)uracil reductase RibD [Hyphomicrobiaceae bacterium]
MSHNTASFDSAMMAIAVRMARRGLGTTAPNPSVGAVIADEMTGEVIARGWTQAGGRPHAEKEALRRAGDRARGKTMYVTLEPCAHTGRTPTCADALVTAGIKRLVCAIPDPNPVVSGRGFAQLRAAGIEVDVGYLAEDARWVTLGHIKRQTEERPFVQLKMALDARGRVAAGDGAPVWVTGPEARAYAHLLRARADAILVGSGTVLADDPELTCRLPGLAHRSPDRIVLDTRLRTPPTAKVYRQGLNRPRVWSRPPPMPRPMDRVWCTAARWSWMPPHSTAEPWIWKAYWPCWLPTV